MDSSLLETGSLPRASGLRQRLCREPPSAKSLREKSRRQRGLCRGSFIRHLAKNLPRANAGPRQRKVAVRRRLPLTTSLSRAQRPALGKEFLIFFENFFAEGSTANPRQSFFKFVFGNFFAEGCQDGPRQILFFFFLEISLPRAVGKALSKAYFLFFLEFLCRGLWLRPSAKPVFYFF